MYKSVKKLHISSKLRLEQKQISHVGWRCLGFVQLFRLYCDSRTTMPRMSLALVRGTSSTAPRVRALLHRHHFPIDSKSSTLSRRRWRGSRAMHKMSRALAKLPSKWTFSGLKARIRRRYDWNLVKISILSGLFMVSIGVLERSLLFAKLVIFGLSIEKFRRRFNVIQL